MSEADTGRYRALPGRLMRAARSAYESRRSGERHESELAEQRRQSETLRNTVAELRFQAETLEKTYSKQLAETRQRVEAAERELAGERSRLAELEAAHEEAVRALAAARGDLERVRADRKLLHDAVASSDALEVKAVRQMYAEARYNAGLATIDELLDDSSWSGDGQPADGARSAPDAEEEPAAEEMISPDLVMTKGRAADGEADA